MKHGIQLGGGASVSQRDLAQKNSPLPQKNWALIRS